MVNSRMYDPTKAEWRESLNPLRGLTMPQLVSLHELQEQGFYANTQWLYRFLEKRDPTVIALVARRKAALRNLQWSVNIQQEFAEGPNKNLAVEQQQALREHYGAIQNLNAAIGHLAHATFRGFTHLEKVYTIPGNAKSGLDKLEYVPGWFWARRKPDPAWLYNARAAQTNVGEAIDPAGWVIRECAFGLCEALSFLWFRSNMSEKDWDAAMEMYGIPSIFVVLPNEVTDPAKVAEYQDIADKVCSDGRGVLPQGASITSVDAKNGGRLLFRDRLSWLKEEKVLIGTGGKLTMLNEATGIGGTQGDNHRDSFDEIVADDASEGSETLQEQVDGPFLDAQFPGKPRCAYFTLRRPTNRAALELVQVLAGLKAVGMGVSPEWVSEEIGFEVTAEHDLAKEAEMLATKKDAPAATNRSGDDTDAELSRRFNRRLAVSRAKHALQTIITA